MLVWLPSWSQVRWHNNATDELLKDLRQSPDPSAEDHYWTTVYSLALQGRMDEIRELLCRHRFCMENKAVRRGREGGEL